jgi:hypothetical protein
VTVRLLAFCAALAAAGVLAPVPAGATVPAAARTMDLTYDVYLGGLHIFTLDVAMTLQRDRYRVSAKGKTEGVVGWLYGWDVKLAAEGLERNDGIEPLRYVTDSAWQGTRRTVDLGFARDGRYRLERTPPPEPDPDIEGGLPQRLPQGTVDPLSLAVAASRALAKTGRCDQTLPVFDGQRRYDLTLQHLDEARLPPSDYSIYHGPAVRCTARMKRISGFRKSWQSKRQWDAPSSAPTIWVAPIRPDLPPVPVRYDGAIALGSIVIHLTRAQVRAGPEEAGAD